MHVHAIVVQDALAVILRASGLKPDDYERYQYGAFNDGSGLTLCIRDFCTRQVRLVRKNRRPAEGVGKKPKKRATTKSAEPARLSPSERDVLLLLKCERAFAQAMVHRRDSASEPRKVYHARKRWKRAEEAASRLVSRRKKHTRDVKPFLHYQLMMKANRLFEYRRWGAAIRTFERALYKDELAPLVHSSCLVSEGSNFFKDRPNPGQVMAMRIQLMESLQRYCTHMKLRAGASSMDVEGEEESDDEPAGEDSGHVSPSGATASHHWFGFVEVSKLSPEAIDEALAATPEPPPLEFWQLASSRMQSYYVLIRSYTHWRRRLAKLEDEEIRDFSWPPGGGRLALIRALGAKARLMCKNIDRFLSWNRHPEFVRDMTAMRGCLEHFAVFFLAVGRILRGRSSQLPPGLPPPRDFRLSFVSEGPAMTNSGRFYDRWQQALRDIAAAFGQIPAGYEMTLCGPQPTRRQASFLETLGEFRLFKRPCQTILAEEDFAEVIPMKPIFYDLAYDMLDGPGAAR